MKIRLRVVGKPRDEALRGLHDEYAGAASEESFVESARHASRARSGIDVVIRSHPATSLLVAAGVSATLGALAGYLLARD